MKPFGFFVIVMVMLTLLSGKVYPQSIQCNIHDIQDCFTAIEEPNVPPTRKCCNELKQHRRCFCVYQERHFTFGSVVDACHIKFDDICPLLSK